MRENILWGIQHDIMKNLLDLFLFLDCFMLRLFSIAEFTAWWYCLGVIYDDSIFLDPLLYAKNGCCIKPFWQAFSKLFQSPGIQGVGWSGFWLVDLVLLPQARRFFGFFSIPGLGEAATGILWQLFEVNWTACLVWDQRKQDLQERGWSGSVGGRGHSILAPNLRKAELERGGTLIGSSPPPPFAVERGLISESHEVFICLPKLLPEAPGLSTSEREAGVIFCCMAWTSMFSLAFWAFVPVCA